MVASIDPAASSAFTVTKRGLGRASGSFQVFLGFQLFEECFEQPSMTGRHDKAVLAHLVDALDKSSGQTELDQLGSASPSFLVVRSDGTTPVYQGFDVVLGRGE